MDNPDRHPENRLQLMALAALHDEGISLPLHTVFRRKPFRLVMKIPTTRSLLRISALYLRMDTTAEDYDRMDSRQRAAFITRHGRTAARMVAHGIVRGCLSGLLLNRPVAWLLLNCMTAEALHTAWRQIAATINTAPFGPIIALAQALNKMQPMASQKEDRS